MVRLLLAILPVLCIAQAAHAEDSDKVGRARMYFETGRLLFEQGDFEEAAKKFMAGYALLPRPQFLLNAGLCYQKTAQLARARAMYERFLAEAPADDPDREHAKAWMAEVDARRAAIKAAQPATAPGTPGASAVGASESARAAPPPAVPPPARTAPAPSPRPAAPSLALATRAPPKKSFIRRNWWIFPVGAAVVAGAVVGIYFATRPSDACAGRIPCLDLR